MTDRLKNFSERQVLFAAVLTLYAQQLRVAGLTDLAIFVSTLVVALLSKTSTKPKRRRRRRTAKARRR